jgi:hypothetical protein
MPLGSPHRLTSSASPPELPLWRRTRIASLMWRDLEPDLATLAVRRQRVVEDPASQVREKPSKSHNGVRSLVLDPVTVATRTDTAADEGGAGLGVHVHRPLGSAVAAGQRRQPVQPPRRRGRGPADRPASDPAPARLQPPRRRIRHHRSGGKARPQPRDLDALLLPSQRDAPPTTRWH